MHLEGRFYQEKLLYKSLVVLEKSNMAQLASNLYLSVHTSWALGQLPLASIAGTAAGDGASEPAAPRTARTNATNMGPFTARQIRQ